MMGAVGRGAFWAGCLIIAALSLRFLVVPMDIVMDHMTHYLPTVPWPMYAHMICGPFALALAPFQLWQGLRARRPSLHRAMGRVYAACVLVAGLASLALLPHFTGTIWAATGFLMMALVWIGTTLRGIWLARAGDLAAHRRWMLRSIAVTFGAVTLRLIMAPLMTAGWSVTETYQITAWASWVPSLIVLEVWLRRRTVATRTARA